MIGDYRHRFHSIEYVDEFIIRIERIWNDTRPSKPNALACTYESSFIELELVFVDLWRFIMYNNIFLAVHKATESL